MIISGPWRRVIFSFVTTGRWGSWCSSVEVSWSENFLTRYCKTLFFYHNSKKNCKRCKYQNIFLIRCKLCRNIFCQTPYCHFQIFQRAQGFTYITFILLARTGFLMLGSAHVLIIISAKCWGLLHTLWAIVSSLYNTLSHHQGLHESEEDWRTMSKMMRYRKLLV